MQMNRSSIWARTSSSSFLQKQKCTRGRPSQAAPSQVPVTIMGFQKLSLQEPRLILCKKQCEGPWEFSAVCADFGIFSDISEDSTPSLMPLERAPCSRSLPRVPFKHNGNQAIERYTGFSKGSSIMWRLCRRQQ